MSWNQSAYTKAGITMLTEALTGEPITITAAVGGAGIVDDDVLAQLEMVEEPRQALTLVGIEKIEDSENESRRIKIHITSRGIAERYVMHQIGIYARNEESAEDKLVIVLQDAHGVEIPAEDENADFSMEFYAVISISNDAQISIEIPPEIMATREFVEHKLEAHDLDLNAHKVIRDALIQLLDEHNSDATAHHSMQSALADLGSRVSLLELMLNTDVSGNPFSVTFESLDGLSATGVWNAGLNRMEF